jgi:hypothetical protein
MFLLFDEVVQVDVESAGDEVEVDDDDWFVAVIHFDESMK